MLSNIATAVMCWMCLCSGVYAQKYSVLGDIDCGGNQARVLDVLVLPIVSLLVAWFPQ